MPKSWHVIRLLSLLAWVALLTAGAKYVLNRYPDWETLIMIGVLVLMFVFIVFDLVDRERVLRRHERHSKDKQP